MRWPPRQRLLVLARTAIPALLALAVVVILALVVRSAFFNGTTTFPAEVQPSGVIYLNFPDMGSVSGLRVHPGEVVRRGALLATQDATLVKLQLAYDQATLAVDSADLAALQSPTLQSAQQKQQALSIDLAEQELNSAQSALAKAANPQEQAADQSQVAEAQTKLALAENGQNLGQAGGSATSVAAAQAAVARDQSAIASDQVALKQANLAAPVAGVVAEVGGSVGDLAGPEGVVGSVSGPQPLPASPTFQLFPVANQSPASRDQSAYTPLVTLYGNRAWQVVAQVPESQVGRFRIGQRISVRVDNHPRRVPARVIDVQPAPVVLSGSVYYDVTCRLTADPPRLLAGMSADVTLGS